MSAWGGLLSLLEYRLAEPLFEADMAESRVAGRKQRALAELGAEIPRTRIGNNHPRVVARAEALTDQLIETGDVTWSRSPRTLGGPRCRQD